MAEVAEALATGADAPEASTSKLSVEDERPAAKTSDQGDTVGASAEGEPKLSKSQQKKLAKEARWRAGKADRRAREKATRREKRAEKRKLVEVHGADPYEIGLQKRPRVQEPQVPFGCNIVVDLSFDDKMTEKEIKSMSTQLGHVYNVNRHSRKPVNVIFTPLNGKLRERMDGTGAAQYKRWKGVSFLDTPLQGLWEGQPATKSEPSAATDGNAGPFTPTIEKADVIYLTADTPDVLETINEGKTYIIGGIVDHNRYKNLCYNIAEEHGIKHAALPIGQYIEMASRKVLTVNQCFEIMSKWLVTKDWEQAFYDVIPRRKFEENKKANRKGGSQDAETSLVDQETEDA